MDTYLTRIFAVSLAVFAASCAEPRSEFEALADAGANEDTFGKDTLGIDVPATDALIFDVAVFDGGATDAAMPLILGAPCAQDLECDTGFCVDGVCCNSACTNGCSTCALPQAKGICSAIAAGAPPRPQSFCPREAQSSCGLDGTCNGAKACRTHVQGTVCKPGLCSSMMATGSAICDGKGTCATPPSKACAPYVCGVDACIAECANDMQCEPAAKCLAKTCFRLDAPHVTSTNGLVLCNQRTPAPPTETVLQAVGTFPPGATFEWTYSGCGCVLSGITSSTLLVKNNSTGSFTVRWVDPQTGTKSTVSETVSVTVKTCTP